jgi:osmoprotectant transport system permease protein
LSTAVLAAAGPVIPNFGHSTSCVRDNHFFCWSWFSENWNDTLAPRLVEHVELTIAALAIGFVISFAAALFAHRYGWFELPFSTFSSFLYTIPSLALFQVLVGITGLTLTTALIPLVTYTLLILFRNTLIGLRGVPAEVREAARGMGYTGRQTLLKVELPLALPAIFAGLRIATVSTVSIATVAAFVIPQGLGRPIFTALGTNVFKTEIIAAGGLAIALALTADALLVVLQRALTPWARRRRL